jgi:signal transduction histidine kinase
LQAARASAANLAHALKTPVATLALTLENDPRAAAQIARIEGVIRHHLAKARTIAVAHRARTPLGSAVADVVGVISTLHPALTIDVAVPDALDVALDAHDLSEILGNLLDNAARHARSRIAVSAHVEDGRVAVTIEDDGPGIAASQRDLALQPGVRLDETPQGDGFGLAIVRDLVALHGGRLDLAEGRWGGLLVALSLLRAA